MSGPLCPDCGYFDINAEKITSTCNFCGWVGGVLPRKKLFPEDYQRRVQEYREKKKQKDEGTLFFVRVYVTQKAAQDSDIDLELMELFELDTMEGTKEDPAYFYIEVEHKPTTELIEKIKAMKEVKKITIY